MPDPRLTRLGDAIDAVAAAAQAAATGGAYLADLTGRLAGAWALVADLDPALAASLRTYTGDAG